MVPTPGMLLFDSAVQLATEPRAGDEHRMGGHQYRWSNLPF